MLRKFPFFGCQVIPEIWKAIFRGKGCGDPGPFSWIHAVLLVRKKRITLGHVNWSLFWFINPVCPFRNLSTRETIYVDCKQALRLGDILKSKSHIGTIMALVKSHAHTHAHAAHEKRRESDVWFCYSVSRIASLATRNEGSPPGDRSPKRKLPQSVWAVPHVNVTFAFRFVRCVNWRCSVSDAILKEADALHVQIVQRAKDIACWSLKKIMVFSALANFEVRSISSVSRIRMKAVHV